MLLQNYSAALGSLASLGIVWGNVIACDVHVEGGVITLGLEWSRISLRLHLSIPELNKLLAMDVLFRSLI